MLSLSTTWSLEVGTKIASGDRKITHLTFSFLHILSPCVMLLITIVFLSALKAVEAGKSVETYNA